MTHAPVPYDPELEEGLAAFLAVVEQVPLRADTSAQNRAIFAATVPPMETIVAGRPVEWEDRRIPGPAGAPDVRVTIVRPKGGTAPGAAGIYQIHGGGMILGTRFFGIEDLVQSALAYGALGVTVEYRLAPENPAPAQAEDSYAGLKWMTDHAAELGFEPKRLLLSGFSAGGGIAAAVALMARDRRGPQIGAVYMGAPMLDDRNDTVSSRQYDGIGAWDRNNNHTGWSAALGARRGTPDVHPYQAPARASDLSRLPHTYIEVGAAEVFRDEAVDYASRIWAGGGQCELHVWAGAYHGFSNSPNARVTAAAAAAKRNWLSRALNL